MMNKIRRFVGEKYTLLRARRKSENMHNFTKFFSDSKTVLLLLPYDGKARDLAFPVVEFLCDRFGNRAMTMIILSDEVKQFSHLNGTQIITIKNDDLGFMFLPKKEILKYINKQRYDLIIDLNIPFEFSIAYICKQTVSKYRVSFVKKYADLFYNIQFRSLMGQSVQLTYHSLIDFLRKF